LGSTCGAAISVSGKWRRIVFCTPRRCFHWACVHLSRQGTQDAARFST